MRERLTVDNAVMLTRVAIPGPPLATKSASLAKEAMENYLYLSTNLERYTALTVEKGYDLKCCEKGH